MDRAAIFDMDGVLIDSEPLWQAAEKAVFARLGIELTDAMCRQTMGMRIDDVVRHWFARFPWECKSHTTVQAEIVDGVSAEIAARGEAMPGVEEVLDLFSRSGWKIGLASSSPLALIHAVVQQLGIEPYFSALCSAFDEQQGKPHPAVYLTAARRLNVEPSSCIAFEDSAAGVASAKAASMKVVVVPDRAPLIGEAFGEADLELTSLAHFSGDLLDRLMCA